jgi:CRP/FNR family cyclic AMP-dependent transcriptional regulator
VAIEKLRDFPRVRPDQLSEQEMLRVVAKAKKIPFNVQVFLNTIDGGRTVATYRKDEKVFSQGDPADSVFFVQKGKVKVYVISEQGKEAIVALQGSGDFFGEGCLTGQPLRLATVSAVTDTVVLRLEKAAMSRVLRDEPKFSQVFLSFLLARNARVEEDLVDQLFNSSEKRLARLLLLMANFGKEGKPEPVIPKISQETLAEMVGTTRSRVSTFMNKFRKLGFIQYNGDLEVHNSLLNVVLHDAPHLRSGKD